MCMVPHTQKQHYIHPSASPDRSYTMHRHLPAIDLCSLYIWMVGKAACMIFDFQFLTCNAAAIQVVWNHTHLSYISIDV